MTNESYKNETLGLPKFIIKAFDDYFYVTRGTYANGTIVLKLHRTWESEETYMVATCNAESLWEGTLSYSESFVWPYVVIKDYGDNEGIVKALETAGVILTGAYIAKTQGRLHTCMITTDWQQILKLQDEFFGESQVPNVLFSITNDSGLNISFEKNKDDMSKGTISYSSVRTVTSDTEKITVPIATLDLEKANVKIDPIVSVKSLEYVSKIVTEQQKYYDFIKAVNNIK